MVIRIRITGKNKTKENKTVYNSTMEVKNKNKTKKQPQQTMVVNKNKQTTKIRTNDGWWKSRWDSRWKILCTLR